MRLHPIAWHCMALHPIAWHCMALHGEWLAQKIEDYSFICAISTRLQKFSKTQAIACASIDMKLILSIEWNSVLNTHTAERDEKMMFTTYTQNIENYSFRCATRTRSKEKLKTLTTASVSMQIKLLFSSVLNSVLSTHAAEHFRRHASGHMYRKHRKL